MSQPTPEEMVGRLLDEIKKGQPFEREVVLWMSAMAISREVQVHRGGLPSRA